MCSILDVQAAWSARLCSGPSGSRRNCPVVSEVGGSKPTGTNSSEVMTWTVLDPPDLLHLSLSETRRATQSGRPCGLKRRTSWGHPHASATLPAHTLAVSSSGTSTMANPPRNSLVSTYGPSEISMLPLVGSAL